MIEYKQFDLSVKNCTYTLRFPIAIKYEDLYQISENEEDFVTGRKKNRLFFFRIRIEKKHIRRTKIRFSYRKYILHVIIFYNAQSRT